MAFSFLRILCLDLFFDLPFNVLPQAQGNLEDKHRLSKFSCAISCNLVLIVQLQLSLRAGASGQQQLLGGDREHAAKNPSWEDQEAVSGGRPQYMLHCLISLH